ncbi:MAG: carboxypeptidase-like regulatory domain-containing protein [Roseiflexaceae bacterium]
MSETRFLRRSTARTIGMALLLMLALLGGQLGAVRETALAAPGNSISGKVVRERADGPGVSGALVSAASNDAVRVAPPTGTTGGYTLALLPSGTYELNVRPTEVMTSSPDWVYAGDPLLVAVPPNQIGQNIIVRTASVTLTGKLALPTGASGDFATPGQRAWVRAENQEGQGNTVRADAAGNFMVRTLPGPILLRITLENSDWTVATQISGLAYHGEPGDTVDVDGEPRTPALDPIAIVAKQATISGKVRLIGGTTPAPQGIPVRAWRLDGSEFAQTTTDSGGLYSMKVISGTWVLRAVPLTDQTYGGQYYVPAQSPLPVRVLSDTASLSDKNLLIAVADVTVSGGTVPGGPGVNGRVYTLYMREGHPEPGPTAPLADAAFTTLRLSSSVATTYTFGVYFPPDTPYTMLSRVSHSVTPSATLNITIPIALDNSHITGVLRLSDGVPATGLPGSIWGASDRGGWARARVNPATGGYDLLVASTDTSGRGGSTWYVRAFVDPTSGYLVGRPRVRRVFLPYNNGDGSTVGDQDFTLLRLADLATIHGRVTNPSGAEGVPGVRVTVRETTGDGASAFERWAITDRQGNYSLRVPPGAYRIRAHFGYPRGLPTLPLIEPAPALVTIGESGSQEVNLRFRLRDAVLRGLVTYNGATHAALVRARSEDGAVVITQAFPSDREGRNYILGLKAGLSWTIEAVASEGSDFLRSNQVVISPTLSQLPLPVGEMLVLTKTGTIPDSQVFVFEADQDQLFTLANGAQVQAPAGSFAISGTVGLFVRPLPALAGVGGAQPISFGYRLSAYDPIGRLPIGRFLHPITLVIPFTRAQLDALGITIDRLVPAYWDEASASWKPVENVAVLPDDTGGGTVNITVDHFTDFALLGAPGGSVYLPSIAR